MQLRVEQHLFSRTNFVQIRTALLPKERSQVPTSFSDPGLYSLLSSSEAEGATGFLSTLAEEEEHEAALGEC